MKKILIIGGIAVLSEFAAIANFGSGYTGAPAPTAITVTLVAGVPVIAITNNVTVQQVQLLTTASSSLVSFYDCSTTNAPQLGVNYTNAAYISTAGYPTNYVTSFIGYNGYTNSYTNTGYWTYPVTNSLATNALPAQGVLLAISGAITSSSNPMSFQQGVSIVATSNATAIVYYTPNK